MRDKINFEANVPVDLVLEYDEGKPVEGRFGDQVMYGVEGNRIMYLDVAVDRQFRELGIRKGEPVRVTKTVLKEGKRTPVKWVIERLGPEAPPRAAKPASEASPEPPGYPGANGKSSTNRNGHRVAFADALRRCLVAALDAARAAEQHAAGENNPVRFTSQDIQGLASTLFIQAAREGYVAFNGNGGAR